MQNKGFIKIISVLLILVCLFYLSFSAVVRYYDNKAKQIANGDAAVEQAYLDSLANEKVYFGNWTLKDCREMGISLGLDLKGGMNVILEVSVPDVIKVLSDNKTDAAFNEALSNAAKEAVNSQDDVITLFIREYHNLAPGQPLAQIFATQQLKDKVTQRSTDQEVERVLREEVKAAVDNSFNVLRTRIDRFGVVQPNIQTLTGSLGRIMVELPGIKEPARVRKLLQGSANLEFWETYEAQDIAPYLQSADAKLHNILTTTETTEEEAAPAEVAPVSTSDSLAAAIRGEANTADLAQLKREHPLLSILQVFAGQGSIVAYANARDTAEVNRYLAMPEVQAELPKDLRLKWGVAPSDLDASDKYDQYGKPAVNMSMNSDGSRRWAQLTKQNIGHSIAIVLDDYVYSAPRVNSEITGGNSEITGNFTPEQSKDLANVLKSGKMPAPAHIVQEDIVGPSLGQASINAGIISFIVALILLMVYMCSMYGLVPGMIANGALIMNLFFTLGILSSFQAALTMSGIAGMVLTLGMAVDANVLIYERTKEELRAGKGTKDALAAGYKNAFSAIFDSNITSLLTGIILFNFGTGPIRGFATTLIIGICISFFTAVFMTRLVYEYFMGKDKLLNLTFTTSISKNLMTNVHFDFMGPRKRWLTIGGVIFLICIGFMAIRGLSRSIDFTGGRNFNVQFENAVEPEDVRALVADSFEDANVSVIAVGTDGRTVRISTNYRINEDGQNVDSEIESRLYEAVKPLLTQNISLDTFIDRDNYTGGSIISSQKVGPSIAEDITYSAIWSVVLALIAIGIYILIRFYNVAYSIGATGALILDTSIILGAYSMFWGILPFSLEVDQTFIGAVLTAIGYSINDKVVIFDRVREFTQLYRKRGMLQVFNDSLSSTLARTINTSVSTLIVLLCIFILGGESIRSFAFAMILGVIFGTMSSLFIASPIAYQIIKMTDKKKEKEEEVKA